MTEVLSSLTDYELTVELFEKGQFFSKLTFTKKEIIIGRQPENDILFPAKADHEKV